MGDYLTGFYYVDPRAVGREWTAEEHRRRARQLLSEAQFSRDDLGLRDLAAAQVHATLALSLETAKAATAEVRPHTHGPFPKPGRRSGAGDRREAG